MDHHQSSVSRPSVVDMGDHGQPSKLALVPVAAGRAIAMLQLRESMGKDFPGAPGVVIPATDTPPVAEVVPVVLVAIGPLRALVMVVWVFTLIGLKKPVWVIQATLVGLEAAAVVACMVPALAVTLLQV